MKYSSTILIVWLWLIATAIAGVGGGAYVPGSSVPAAGFAPWYPFRDMTWLGNVTPGAASAIPTNMAGIFANFDATLTLNAPVVQNTIVDTVQGLTFTSAGGSLTNAGKGYWLNTNGSGWTNASPWQITSNYTFNAIICVAPYWQPSNGNQTGGPQYAASIIDGKFRLLFGNTNGSGYGISNGIFCSYFGGVLTKTLCVFPSTNWFCPTWQITVAATNLYTNGVYCGPIIQTTNNFPWDAFGAKSAVSNFNGYVTSWTVWTNVLSSNQVAQVYVWNATNQMDYIAGLTMRIKMNEGSGTTYHDSLGTNNFLAQSAPFGNPTWTNGFANQINQGLNYALSFNSNYILSATSGNLLKNCTNITICYWYKGTGTTLHPNPSAENPEPLITQSSDILPNSQTISIFNEEYYNVIDQSLFLYQANGNQNEATFCNPNDGTWHFVCAEITTNSIGSWWGYQYIDGILSTTNNGTDGQATGDIKPFSNTNGFDMASDPFGYTGYATGCQLADVQVYTNLLNWSQINEKYRYGPSK